MSYILDALKRADAERERGQVPGLRSQSPSVLTPNAVSSPTRRTARVVALGAASLLVCAAGALWWWLSPARIETPAPPVATSSAPLTAPTVSPAPAAPPPVTQAASPPTAPALPILAPAPATRDPSVAVAPMPSTGAPPTASSVGKGNPNGVPSFAELPAETRGQLPSVNVSGSTYSSNPAHRMLIVNGKVVHEGEEIAPGLKLDAIGPDKAVLNHGGTRYSIGY